MDSAQNTIVSIRVQQVLPFGLQVSLPDGSIGIIREREIAWSRKRRRGWRQRFGVGQMLQAVLLGEGHNQRLELSLRFAEHDPWIDLDQRYPLGSLVVGEVTGLQPYGIFVEIESGITGLVHLSRLPHWAQHHKLAHLFWVGDSVKVVVERINLHHRQISFSISRALHERWPHRDHGASARGALPNQHVLANAPAADTDRILQLGAAPQPSWTILIVEDDEPQREALARWLVQNGHRVITAGSAEEGLVQIDQAIPDLVLSDFGLPHRNGIELLASIRDRYPSVRRALMTDWARAGEHAEELELLRSDGSQILMKPLRPADILELLTEGESQGDVDTDVSENLLAHEMHQMLLVGQNAFDRQLHQILSRLQTSTDASIAVIFAFDPAQRQIGILAAVGREQLDLQATIDLVHSPVRDVAEDDQICIVDDAERASSRVRYLRPLLSFRSCLGLRPPTQLPLNYALFLFSSHCDAFGSVHRDYAVATALAIAALLEREQFQRRALELQRVALLGHMSRALVHEISHQLGPVNFVLGDIESQVQSLQQRAVSSGPEVTQALHACGEMVRDLDRVLQRLTETTHMFGRVTVQSRELVTDLDEVLSEVVQLLRDMTDRSKVDIVIEASNDLPAVRVQMMQLQQILLNILLNAVQQITLMRTSGGRIVIRAQVHKQEGSPVVRISIEDDGPGIHHRLWLRVFDLGYTTRNEGGSGLGLYITQSLAHALGGRVAIQESCMLWGTTVIVDLPIVE